MGLDIKVVGKSDVGLVRTGNEDFLHIDKSRHVYAVCDGMGGHQAGEVASMSAASTLRMLFSKAENEIANDPTLAIGRILPPSGDLLLKSVRIANRHIYNQALSNDAQSGMGTTIVALTFDRDMMSIVHVGDSRAYRLDERELVPLTRDHSWVEEIQSAQNISREEAETAVGKNVITRALGVRGTVETDYRLTKVKKGDIYILCSDGLCGFADDDEIFEIANRSRNDLNKLVDSLIQMANDRGGADNVTVIALQIEDVTESALPEVEVFTLKAETEEQLAREDEIIKRLQVYEMDDSITQETVATKESKKPIVLIFALFIVIAMIIMYISASGN